MKEIILNYNDYKTKDETFKDFYRDIFIKLDGNTIIDFEGLDDLGYNGNILNEFMWYVSDENLKLVFLNLDLAKIAKENTIDDYEWKLIIEVLQDFVKDYPNNTLEFRNE